MMTSYTTKGRAAAAMNLPKWRAVVLFGFLLLCLLALVVRSAYLQVVHNDFLQEKGEARYSRTIELSAHRGKMLDRNGVPMAISTPVQSVWASPSEVVADNQQIQQLAKILELPVETVRKRLADVKRDFVYLKRQLPPSQVEQVQALNLRGVSLKREYRRYYPAGDEVAHLLGFTGNDDIGKEGLEKLLQSQLAGQPGSQQVIKDRRGRVVEEVGGLRPPKPGRDVQLSVDSKIQHVAWRELKNAVEEHKAKSGSVVVLDAQTGEVLAMTNYPAYNPNNRKNVDVAMIRNRAVTDLFEPGSTMKPFAVSTALELGRVNPSMVIDTEDGAMVINGRRIRDSHPEPDLTVAGVIQKSSNIGSAKISLLVDPVTMWQSLVDAGFGQATGSGFPGERLGVLRSGHKWRPIEQATVSYGHGMSVNLLQLARSYTVFGNRGVLMPVSLFKQDKAIAGTRVYSSRTAETMLSMMEMATLPGGTAPKAQVAGYRVAGKTGTAHKLEGGRYVNKYVSSFVGLAPVSNPRVIVAVMVDEPSNGKYYGGLVAAPVFSKVVGAALHDLGVPYDAPLDNVIEPNAAIVREEV